MATISNRTIEQAARELVVRYGEQAINEATDWAESFARKGDWTDHDKTLRMLTVVEDLVRDSKHGMAKN
jgi:hypothetical protein